MRPHPNEKDVRVSSVQAIPRSMLLLAGWIGLTILTGIIYILIPPSQMAWLLVAFWLMTLVLILVLIRSAGKLGRSADRLQDLVHQSRDLLWAVDKDLCFTSLCGAVSPITGQEARALVRTPLTRLLSTDKAKAFGMMVKKGTPFTMEAGIQHPDGRYLAVEICGAPGGKGNGTYFKGVIRDVSDQKRHERKQQALRLKLEQSEKLKNLGLLTGSVAHDLNNILSGIATYPEVLLMDQGLDQNTRQGIEMIRDSGRKASGVVSDLLTISRGARAEKQVLNINTVIERYLTADEFEKIQNTFCDVAIEVDMEPELLNIRGSYVHIEKAVMNLILNGVEETTRVENGCVEISTANVYVDDTGGEAGDTDLPPGEYALLRVADNGSGLPEGFRDKIFDPFFTQKEMGRSTTGLGLTVVKNTVQDHKGRLRVTSGSQGTVFDLYFPAVREELPTLEDPATMEELRGNGETLLIVDDLASQRKIAATILKNLGYKVFSVADGMDAIAFVKEMPVDLIVLDMVMAPGISGYETYRRIKEFQPEQKAIIASGHSESDDVFKTLDLGAGSFVKKPYTIMDMGIAVKEELEKR